MNYKRFLIIISLFVFVLPLRAQDKGNAVLLKTIFENISKKHQVSFNYIEEEIAVFKLVPPSNSLTLQEKLNYITEKTQLKFEFISKKNILVINNQKRDKTLFVLILKKKISTIKFFICRKLTKKLSKKYYKRFETRHNKCLFNQRNYQKKRWNI